MFWTEYAEESNKREFVIFLARFLKSWILGGAMIWVLGSLWVFVCSCLLIAKKNSPVRRCDINLSLGDFSRFLMTRMSDGLRNLSLFVGGSFTL